MADKAEAPRACPFCGRPGQIKKIVGKFGHGWVGCPVCKVYMDWSYEPSGAIRKWNRRAGLTAARAMDAVESIYTLAPEEREDMFRALIKAEEAAV